MNAMKTIYLSFCLVFFFLNIIFLFLSAKLSYPILKHNERLSMLWVWDNQNYKIMKTSFEKCWVLYNIVIMHHSKVFSLDETKVEDPIDVILTKSVIHLFQIAFLFATKVNLSKLFSFFYFRNYILGFFYFLM